MSTTIFGGARAPSLTKAIGMHRAKVNENKTILLMEIEFQFVVTHFRQEKDGAVRENLVLKLHFGDKSTL